MTNRRTMLQLIAGAGAIALVPATARAQTAWDFTFEALEGGAMPLSQWRGKVLLVVNTASFCGFTPQYRDLVQVWQDYRDRGLVVIGAPSTDFRQEYDEAGKIKDFCELTYGVDFPMTAPVHVVGAAAHPFFKWAAAESGQRVRWNFNKYLIGRDGRIITWMPSTLKPTARKARAAIEAALAAPAA
ncbi:glutathione peroxidase [Ruegeria intermedia]|uniref:Glutathione peroxidase n=1 Tax=Ruegeria intermedia TaxID=996115 RepID=A0A1M5AP24_9RHOB|nr:glutathione peroxidase [Ruegeria intermedia]SHF31925.1 glutathione peroxidase [Ruegeria intermedia]